MITLIGNIENDLNNDVSYSSEDFLKPDEEKAMMFLDNLIHVNSTNQIKESMKVSETVVKGLNYLFGGTADSFDIIDLIENPFENRDYIEIVIKNLKDKVRLIIMINHTRFTNMNCSENYQISLTLG